METFYFILKIIGYCILITSILLVSYVVLQFFRETNNIKNFKKSKCYRCIYYHGGDNYPKYECKKFHNVFSKVKTDKDFIEYCKYFKLNTQKHFIYDESRN